MSRIVVVIAVLLPRSELSLDDANVQGVQRSFRSSGMSGVFESRDSAAYWAYHVGRMGFFTVQGITGGYCSDVRDVFSRPVWQQRHHQGRQLFDRHCVSSCVIPCIFPQQDWASGHKIQLQSL